MAFLAWLQVQATAIAGTITAVASNNPEPARNVAAHLIMAVVACTALITILRKFAK